VAIKCSAGWIKRSSLLLTGREAVNFTRTINRKGRSVMNRQRTVALWAFLGLLVASVSLTGCNTIRGMGEDVEAAGSGISGTAQDVEDDMKRK
jgi:predicted small secreted protein